MKTPLILLICLAALVAGCAGRSTVPAKPGPQILTTLGSGQWLELASSAPGQCDATKVVYVDEPRGLRQTVVDWTALDDRSGFTLSPKGRAGLVERIRDKAKMGCTLVEFRSGDYTWVATNERHQAWAFVRYWLEGDQIRLQLRQVVWDRDSQTGELRTKREQFNFSEWSDLRVRWDYQPYNGPVALPQVVYRIDEHRFFEAVPWGYLPCSDARLFYNDTAKGIRTNVMDYRVDGDIFIIDAASDQFLVAPILESSSGCQTGGGHLCAGYLYFSQDAGKTWIGDMPLGGANYLTKDTLYSLYRIRPGDISSGDKASLDVPIPPGPHSKFLKGGALERTPILKWTAFFNEKIPLPVKMPLDTRFSCNSDEKK